MTKSRPRPNAAKAKIEPLPLEPGQLPGTIGSEARFLTAMRKVRGLQSYAAKMLGVSRQAVNAYIKKHGLKEHMTDIAEQGLDMSEARLFERIDEGNVHAIMFHLKTQGKERGYVESHRIEGSRDNPIQVQHTIGPDLDGTLELALLSIEEVRELRTLSRLPPTDMNPDQFVRLKALMAKASPTTIEVAPNAQPVAALPSNVIELQAEPGEKSNN